jgi:hypothetical protein
VRAARSAPGPRGSAAGTSDLLVGRNQLDLTTGGRAAAGAETVTNLSDRPRLVHASVRSSGIVLGSQTQTVPLSATTSPRFVDGFGRNRAFTTTTFTVPPGATRLGGAIAWAGPGFVVRLVLLEPDGTYAGFTLPQGAGNYGFADVPSPVPGTWTAVLYTAASAAGFTGNVQLTTTSFGTGRGGVAVPADFVLGPHQTRTVGVLAAGGGAAGDGADELVLASRAVSGSDGAASSVVPVVVRTLIGLDRHGQATFTGTFAGGNGRAGIPNPSQTYAFDVPREASDLSVGLKVTGDPNQVMYGFLVDPNGEPLSERTNQRLTSTGDVTLVNGLQLTRLRPQPGRWQFVFAVFGPVAGTATTTSFTGSVALDTVRAAAAGLPTSAHTVLRAGRAVQATVVFLNQQPNTVDQQYTVDARQAASGTLPLVVQNGDYTIPGAPLAPFPGVQVPTQTDALTVSGQADHPMNFEVSPFPADHVTDLSFEGDPDRIAGPAGSAPSVTVSDPEVAPQTWLALPAAIGPFGDAGAGDVHTTFTGSVLTRLFDRTVGSSTGDPLLSYVDASAPAATPLAVPAGGTGTIHVTITPNAPRGTVVRGVLYLNTQDAVTGGTDEVAAFPYTYTVG